MILLYHLVKNSQEKSLIYSIKKSWRKLSNSCHFKREVPPLPKQDLLSLVLHYFHA